MLICAAVKFYIKIETSDDKEIIIPCLHHRDAYKTLDALEIPYEVSYAEEGFITHKNIFLTKFQAYQHAMECGQLSNTVQHHIINEVLFSEDLY